uniref:Serine palmitoyltransferase n=1 Tax=Candidatus Kentrum sp. FW TaxID=2126338 RepID=A0A450TYK0_9GAMM|nr:MAG: serine palmitoyltransferase [Candidatus Kentron sp. FW]
MNSRTTNDSHESDLLNKFQYYVDGARVFDDLPHKPYQTIIDKVLSPCEVIVKGKRTLMLGANNYLGLTADPGLKELAKQTIDEYGIGTTGARPMNGNFLLHKELEKEIADFMGCRHAVVFTTGYQTNLGFIPTLCGLNDIILIDADCHASIYDGCQMSNADTIRFRHNNVEDLERRLKRLEKRRKNKLIIVESCYSVLGDITPLEKIVELKQEYNAYLLVDDAHGFGVFGKTGRGLAQELGIEDQVDFTMGTFSKALAGIGGFIVSNHEQLPYLHYCARSYMFSASASPANITTVTRALKIIREKPHLRKALWDNSRYMRQQLKGLGFDVVDADSPIVSLIVGEQEKAILFWEALLEAGVYVNVYVPPTTPKDRCVIRTSYSPTFDSALLDEALSIFSGQGRLLGVI